VCVCSCIIDIFVTKAEKKDILLWKIATYSIMV
jgi:hypothetical protein